MTEKEFERKSIFNCEKYNMWLSDFTKKFPREDIFQLNYYYDTHGFALFHCGETLRVRQIGETLKLQYKSNKSYFGEMRVSDEYSEKVDELPKIIAIHGLETYNVGIMATERINFNVGDCVVSLDKNYYLGMIDYEIEVETKKEHDLPVILKNLSFHPDSKGKYSRYVEKFLNNGGYYAKERVIEI